MHYAKRRKKSIKYLSTIFLNDFLHNIPAFLHVGGQFELGSGAVEVLSLVVDVKVVVALQIIGEEAHATFHRHQFGYFCKTFSNIEGTSPTEYRKANQVKF